MAWFLGSSCPAPCGMVSGDKLSYVLLNYQKPHQVASEEQNFSYTLVCSGIKELYVYHAHHSKNNSEGCYVRNRKLRPNVYVLLCQIPQLLHCTDQETQVGK